MIDRDTKLDRDSILVSVKKIIGIDKDYDQFDNDITMHTNTVLFYLEQIGIGKKEFELEDASQTWSEFVFDKQLNVRAIKTYVGLRVKLLFDPPTSSVHLQAINEQIKEAEWRMYITENYTDEDFKKHYYGEKDLSDIIGSNVIKEIQPYLYEISYVDMDYEYADNYFKTKSGKIGAFGCSSVRKGSWYGRNFDWFYSNQAEFIVHTSGKNLHKTVGIAGQLDELTEDFVKSGKYSDAYKILPFMVVDGINDCGVVCNTNVVPKDKGTTTGTKPEIETKEKLCSIMLPRFILDNFSTAKGAVTYLRDYVSIYSPVSLQNMDYDVHIMVADRDYTYLIEFIDNEFRFCEISSKSYMTNFHILDTHFLFNGKVYTPADVSEGHLPGEINKISPHGSGLERYNLIVDNYQNCGSLEGMKELMCKLKYTNAYNDSIDPYWYSEFVGVRNLTVDSPVEDYEEILPIVQDAYRNRRREGAAIKTWQTCHTSIYDIENKCLYLSAQEWNNIYEVKICQE